MSTTAKRVKDLDQTPKYAIRRRNRCRKCGRPRAYLRKFALCRLCFRELALRGEVAGVIKSSW
ncbi:MAG TPA: type Z 30S ribosomal protein S14 [Vicinamibacterales bacterium]|jgi:small subunit ribosomal protein S14|nr:type Z 30S ribosomal protein S14 [Vicinamibacterales bacterium]